MSNPQNDPNNPANANAGASSQLIFGFTRQQILQGLGVIMTLVGTIATSTGWLTQAEADQLTQTITTVVTALVGAAGVVITIWQTRKAVTVAAASQVPGVQVHVNTTPASPAPQAVKDLVASEKEINKDVVPMGPIVSAPHEVEKPNVEGVTVEGKSV